jgi:hypothetical protein
VEVDAIMNLGDIDGDGEIDLQVRIDDNTKTVLHVLDFATTLSIPVLLGDFIIRTFYGGSEQIKNRLSQRPPDPVFVNV